MTPSHLTDRMPDVRHGLDAWSESDAIHLASCRECSEEWRVVCAIPVPVSNTVDTDALTAALLHRLRAEPHVLPMRRRGARRLAWVGLAAAAALAIAVLVPGKTATTETANVPSREATLLPELDALLEAELERVLASIDETVPDPLGTIPRLGDLTDEELETLLEEVEG